MKAERPPLRRFRVWIPIVTLIAVGVAFYSSRERRRSFQALEIAPPQSATLPPLELEALSHSLSGVLLDPERMPVDEALIFLRAGQQPFWTLTDAQGRFTFERLAGGTWHLSVVVMGFVPKILTTAPESFLEIQLESARPDPPSVPMPMPTGSGLEGRVVPAIVTPVENFEVVLTPIRSAIEFGAPLPRRAKIGPDGSFHVPGLAIGDYRVCVLPAWARGGSWPDLASPLSTGALPDAQILRHREDGPAFEITLQNGLLQGVLTDDRAEAVEGALVLVTPDSDPSRVWPPVMTDEAGRFSLRDLPQGFYRVMVRAGGHLEERTIEVRAGEVRRVDFEPIARPGQRGEQESESD